MPHHEYNKYAYLREAHTLNYSKQMAEKIKAMTEKMYTEYKFRYSMWEHVISMCAGCGLVEGHPSEFLGRRWCLCAGCENILKEALHDNGSELPEDAEDLSSSV